MIPFIAICNVWQDINFTTSLLSIASQTIHPFAKGAKSRAWTESKPINTVEYSSLSPSLQLPGSPPPLHSHYLFILCAIWLVVRWWQTQLLLFNLRDRKLYNRTVCRCKNHLRLIDSLLPCTMTRINFISSVHITIAVWNINIKAIMTLSTVKKCVWCSFPLIREASLNKGVE